MLPALAANKKKESPSLTFKQGKIPNKTLATLVTAKERGPQLNP